ncbi:hypothetical protein HYU23_01100 [Candidatus Woesearchaeota archaeon]|nr:hypothetical protein [Candidatus Woesearchaeota archaeon]
MKSNRVSKNYVDSNKLKNKFLEIVDVLKKQGYTEEDITNLIKKPKEGIPVAIFSNDELSCLESIVKFLKENKELAFSEIASLLNRDQRTIWVTHSKARKKKKEFFVISDCEYYIPFEIFRDRNLGVLENICLYLKDVCNLSFHQIAVLLRRNDRTIWTSYHKARGKAKK